MNQREARLEDFLGEIGYGDIKITVVDGKLFQIPAQRIERPSKHGVYCDIRIDQPIRLKRVQELG